MTTWTKPDCQFCTGSHHMLDQPEMGPCVCASAENLTAAEAEIERLERLLENDETTRREYGEALGTINAISDSFTRYLRKAGLDNVRALPDDDLEAISEYLDAWE